MKKEIGIQVSRGAFGKPLYRVSVYNTEKLANLRRCHRVGKKAHDRGGLRVASQNPLHIHGIPLVPRRGLSE